MNKTDKTLWLITIISFLLVVSIFFLVKKKELFIKPSPKPKYINFEQVANIVKPSVLKINSSIGTAYGVIIHPRGYVLTLYLEGSQLQKFYLIDSSGQSFECELIKTDKKTKFAIMKIIHNQEFPYTTISYTPKTAPDQLLFSPTDKGLIITKIVKIKKIKSKQICSLITQ